MARATSRAAGLNDETHRDEVRRGTLRPLAARLFSETSACSCASPMEAQPSRAQRRLASGVSQGLAARPRRGSSAYPRPCSALLRYRTDMGQQTYIPLIAESPWLKNKSFLN